MGKFSGASRPGLWSLFFLVVIGGLAAGVGAWYLPGAAPIEYQQGAAVTIKVNSLHSVKTQLPLRYYSMPFCQPATIADSVENLGEILMGDLIQNSPFDIKMGVDVKCQRLCARPLSAFDKKQLSEAIDDEYLVHMQADGLPVAMRLHAAASIPGEKPADDVYVTGFPLGVVNEREGQKKHALHNHLSFILRYHQHSSESTSSLRIVGFEVAPRSIKFPNTELPDCAASEPLILESVNDGSPIAYSYDVKWEESPVRWATRWDMYLRVGQGDSEIHWFSIINSLMIVLFLSGIIATIILRTLLRDIARYNDFDNLEEAQEESGWKLVHGDVFRRPRFSKLLAACAGTGVQIFGMTMVTLVFATLGILSPANRGGLLQAMLLLFTLMGFPAGYVSARFTKLFDGQDVTRNVKVTFYTAFQFPGVCFTIFFILNILLWKKGSTGAVPFGTMFLILLLWFGISVPLVFAGSHFGYRRPQITLPVRTNQIPREMPPQPLSSNFYFTSAIGGILPFGAVFTELLFILSSIWQHQPYYLFGFLSLVLAILMITCAEISIAFTYFQLTSENYHWWWRSYWVSAASSIYVFLYAVFYFTTRLSITKVISALLYFGYMFILSYAFGLLTGAIGFISTFLFVRAIYGSIKVD